VSTRTDRGSEFVAYLEEVFETFGPIQAKRMFGGYGIYRDALMFALVSDDVLYLKTDEAMATELAALGMPPFEYTKQGNRTQIAYYMAPAGVFDDRDEAKRWADRAYAAALRAKQR
jgi:DNA transformation protein